MFTISVKCGHYDFRPGRQNTSYVISLKQPEFTLPLVSATKYQTHKKGQFRQVHLLSGKIFSTQLWKQFSDVIKCVTNSFNLWLCLLLPVLTGSSAICTVVRDSSFIAVTLQEPEAHKQPPVGVPFCEKVSPQFTPIKASAEHTRRAIYSFLVSVPLCCVEMLSFALINVDSRLTLATAAEPPAGDS